MSQQENTPQPLFAFEGSPKIYTIEEIFSLKRNRYFDRVAKPRTPDQYRRPEITLNVSEQDLDILLFKLHNNNLINPEQIGSLPPYPGELWFTKKALIYGRMRLYNDVIDFSNAPDPWAIIAEV